MSRADTTNANPLFVPGVRDYIFLGLAAALVLFLAMSFHSSLVPALLIAMMAASGLVLRFVVAPGLVIILTSYFLIDPFTQLLTGASSALWRPESNSLEFVFSVTDMVIVLSLLVYLIAQYRVYSLTSGAIPGFRRPRARSGGEKRPGGRRPAAHVLEAEFTHVFVAGLLAMVGGQVVTLAIFMLGPEEPRFGPGTRERFDRTALFIWLLVIGGVLFTAVVAYLRMRRMSTDEARRFLENTAWNETQREQNRVQRWRVWMRWWGGGR